MALDMECTVMAKLTFDKEQIEADYDIAKTRGDEIIKALGLEDLGIGEPVTKDDPLTFNLKCYLCTTSVQVAISAAVGVAFAPLAAGGEIAAAAAETLGAAICVVIGITANAVANFVLGIMQDCSGPGELCQELANKACNC